MTPAMPHTLSSPCHAHTRYQGKDTPISRGEPQHDDAKKAAHSMAPKTDAECEGGVQSKPTKPKPPPEPRCRPGVHSARHTKHSETWKARRAPEHHSLIQHGDGLCWWREVQQEDAKKAASEQEHEPAGQHAH
jgi:hypothetical protein